MGVADLYITKHRVIESRGSNRIMVRKFGASAAIGTTLETVWSKGGVYAFPTASTMRIAAGGNANDTVAGTGARYVAINGIEDVTWDEVTEVVATAGTSASASTTTVFARVHRSYVTEVGAYGGVNAGDINIEDSGSTGTYAFIETGFSQTEMCIYTVPTGYVGYVTRISASAETSKPMELHGVVRRNADNTANPSPIQTVFRRLSLENEFTIEFTAPDALPARADFWIEAKRLSAGTSSIYAELDIQLVRIT